MLDVAYQDQRAISIHTLAWRVTKGDTGESGVQIISIHTLAWRVTPVHCKI